MQSNAECRDNLILSMDTRVEAVDMDLSTYTTTEAEYKSFLSLSWAIVADVDLESEVLRVLGPLRFDVYAVWRMMALRRYSAEFSYLPAGADDTVAPLGSPVPENWVTIADDFSCFWALQNSHASSTMYCSPM